MDLLNFMKGIVARNTKFYQSDFGYDKKMLRRAVKSEDKDDRHLLWMSRSCGTYLFRERDVFISGTYAHSAWCAYDQAQDHVLAYAIDLDSTTVRQLPYQKHSEYVQNQAIPADRILLIYKNGRREIPVHTHFDVSSDEKFGEFIRFEMLPADEGLLRRHIENAPQGKIQESFDTIGSKRCKGAM